MKTIDLRLELLLSRLSLSGFGLGLGADSLELIQTHRFFVGPALRLRFRLPDCFFMGRKASFDFLNSINQFYFGVAQGLDLGSSLLLCFRELFHPSAGSLPSFFLCPQTALGVFDSS